jgi:NADH-quinone oxidoreductase subunit J
LQLLVFVAATLMVIAGAIGVVVRRRAVHAALSLVLTLFGVAVHFVAMEAHFLAAVQVIVYAGAIVVLILFVIMLLGVDRAEDLEVEPLPIQRPLAAIVGVAIVALVVAAIFAARESGPLQVGAGIEVEVAEPAGGGTPQVTPDANIKQLSRNLFGDQVFAFELTGVLLVVAVAGTVVMTRRERKPSLRSSATQAAVDRSSAGATSLTPEDAGR